MFSTVAETAAKGIDWGQSAASKSWSAAKEFGAATADFTVRQAERARDAAHKAAVATRDFAIRQKDRAVKSVNEGWAETQAAGAERAVTWALADNERFEALKRKLDKRGRFSSNVCQECGSAPTGHPDPRDGKFLGGDCCQGGETPKVHDAKPSMGAKPPGCQCGKGGKPFPKVVFTNGINNTAKQVCETMHALAKSRCVEVVGVFNATYADPSLQAPERRAADYADAARAAKQGATDGAVVGGLTYGAPGAAAGAAIGSLRGVPDAALQEASRSGMVQDVLDCVDTITKRGDEAATATLSKEIVESLNADPPAMTIYAHSQGGLNTAAAIAQARGELVNQETDRLRRDGVPLAAAEAAAVGVADRKLAGLTVHTFGTLERGLPDGPTYHRYRNDFDPVPRVIHAAQSRLAPDDLASEPKSAPPVKRIPVAPSAKPMSAHKMKDGYLDYLDKTDNRQPCC